MGIEGSCPWGGCVKAIVSVGGGTLNQEGSGQLPHPSSLQ